MQICKLTDGKPSDIRDIPGAWGNISNPTLADLTGDGWREYVPAPVLNIKVSHWQDDGRAIHEIVDAIWTADEIIAERTAQDAAQQSSAAAATQAQEQAYLLAVEQVTPLADQYRDLLRKYFGDGAELNHAVTKESVLGYFALLTGSGAITAQQVADAALIQTLFVVLAPIATDRAYSSDNTWSSTFWSLIR
jgi:hypothetical protein